MNRKYKNREEVESVLKEAVWLAWQAAGGPMGMGHFQDNPEAAKEDVWNNVMTSGDYPGPSHGRDGYLNADYVFGRMMKLRLNYDKKSIEIPDHKPRSDYQAWCRTYKSYEALLDVAQKNVQSQVDESKVG